MSQRMCTNTYIHTCIRTHTCSTLVHVHTHNSICFQTQPYIHTHIHIYLLMHMHAITYQDLRTQHVFYGEVFAGSLVQAIFLIHVHKLRTCCSVLSLCIYIYIYVYIYICIYIYLYAHTHIHTHTKQYHAFA
jgi:hypothetical protein